MSLPAHKGGGLAPEKMLLHLSHNYKMSSLVKTLISIPPLSSPLLCPNLPTEFCLADGFLLSNPINNMRIMEAYRERQLHRSHWLMGEQKSNPGTLCCGCWVLLALSGKRSWKLLLCKTKGKHNSSGEWGLAGGSMESHCDEYWPLAALSKTTRHKFVYQRGHKMSLTI